jgi:hypothetical protein
MVKLLELDEKEKNTLVKLLDLDEEENTLVKLLDLCSNSLPSCKKGK